MLIDIGEIRLNYAEWRAGEEIVVFIHGNLACGMWFDLVGPLVAQNFRVIAVDWRGCGASDKPASLSDYSNYTIRQHAQDMLAAIRGLGIDRCHLATHSTGGLISSYMLLMEPERFGNVLALNPVSPMALRFPAEIFALFEVMKASRERTRATLALTASTLFRPETLATASQPMFADHATLAQKQWFERLVDRTLQVSDGIWFGTATDLDQQWRTGGLRTSQGSIEHRHLVLWGALDLFIPKQDMDEMSARMPHCRRARRRSPDAHRTSGDVRALLRRVFFIAVTDRSLSSARPTRSATPASVPPAACPWAGGRQSRRQASVHARERRATDGFRLARECANLSWRQGRCVALAGLTLGFANGCAERIHPSTDCLRTEGCIVGP